MRPVEGLRGTAMVTKGGSVEALHHLLSHTVGVPHWLEAPGLDPAEPMRISERLEIIQATPLRTEPGAQWHYSSPGFVLAGFIVERASGQPYRDFLAERILSPCS